MLYRSTDRLVVVALRRSICPIVTPSTLWKSMHHQMPELNTMPFRPGKSDYLLRGTNRYGILRAELQKRVERYHTGSESREEAA
jgi:hypothetical protein